MLNYNLSFIDLYTIEGLIKVNSIFMQFLQSHDVLLFEELNRVQLNKEKALLFSDEESALLISIAPILEKFIIDLFKINDSVLVYQNSYNNLQPLFKCKKLFINKRIAKLNSKIEEEICLIYEQLNDLGFQKLPYLEKVDKIEVIEFEIEFANKVLQWEEEENEHKLKIAENYAIWATFSQEGQKIHKDGILFKLVKKLDFDNLIADIKYNDNDHKTISLAEAKQRHRDGFKLNDDGISREYLLNESHYCIYCHNRGKDSCSKGIIDKQSKLPSKNPLGVELSGCPLKEKISEMNLLSSKGYIIGALAVAIVDNPMLAATGHRICNECMRSCIYQKQQPVNIPALETKVLDEVLNLPWGFEIYSLLTRWNPLNINNLLPKSNNGHKVLVVGLGPAGFTLSHYLINEGFTVVAIDGLKIEKLPHNLSGVDIDGNKVKFQPIKDIKEIKENLEDMPSYGFGGVMEYGITVRWDKNYLKVIRLLLERRSNFRMYGGIRFGSNITYNDAKELGFDHIALAIGAGKPRIPDIPNALVKGVKTASDFLMNLQLGRANLNNSLSNLQIRLPIVIIGAGLTAIDSATESLAYYKEQAINFVKRYRVVGNSFIDELNDAEKNIAMELIDHGKQLEKADLKKQHELLKAWGGVTVIYRQKLIDSPSYRLNYEELQKGFEEGINFIENAIPKSLAVDESDCCIGLNYQNLINGNHIFISARTIIIAIGTEANTTLAKEYPELFALNQRYFQLVDNEGKEIKNIADSSNNIDQFFILKTKGENNNSNSNNEKEISSSLSISCLGDAHPAYSGSVVKAMASAKNGYKVIAKIIKEEKENVNPESLQDHYINKFFNNLNHLLIAKVVKVERLNPKVIEISVFSPIAAKNFHPGQFFRLQNYLDVYNSSNNSLLMEELALTGANVDKESGIISFIILEIGASSKICSLLKVDEQVVLMGPTGTPTEIPEQETVMLIGGGVGNAVLFSIGKAMKDKGCKILYFAGYRESSDRFKETEIEKSADIVVWCCDKEKLSKNRMQDLSIKGNMIEAIEYYGELSNDTSISSLIPLNKIDRVLTIGSDSMMQAVAYARHNKLAKYFKNNHIAISSINSPMQCMMKEICAKCLQRHYDPITKEEKYIYSCFNQDQDSDKVDYKHLSSRLGQNSVLEKLTNKWLKCTTNL